MRSISVSGLLAFLWLCSAFSLPAQNRFLDFDGVDDRINLGVYSELASVQQFTFEVWVRFESLPNFGGIMYSHASNGNRVIMSLGGTGLGNSDDIQVAVGNGSNTGAAHTTCNCIAINQWYHLVFSFDRTQSVPINRYQVHINGVPYPLTSPQGIPSVTTPNPTTAFLVVNGQMDEIRLWDHVRSTAQIQANKDLELTGNESGLLRYYNFNDGSCGGNNTGSTTLADQTANNRNGTLLNFARTGCVSNYVCAGTTCNLPGNTVQSRSSVPTLSQWGLIVLCLLMLNTAAVMLLRRKRLQKFSAIH